VDIVFDKANLFHTKTEAECKLVVAQVEAAYASYITGEFGQCGIITPTTSQTTTFVLSQPPAPMVDPAPVV